MPALSVIKNLDIFKDTLSRFRSAVIILWICPFILQLAKEAFSYRNFVAVALTAHTAIKLINLESLSVIGSIKQT
jgi:hypothetical protein